MQEEVTQRTVALCVEATKLSAGMLQRAMKKVLDEMQKGVIGHKTKLHHGKQTLRQLMKHNTGVSNIEITDQNIRAFSATAKKYGIDFALKKDTSGDIPRYLVFFKGRDADVNQIPCRIGMVTHTAVIPVSERAGIEQKRSPLLLILRLHIRVVFLWRSYSTLLPQAQETVPLASAP